MTATTQYKREMLSAAEANMLAAASVNQLVKDQLQAMEYEVRGAALKGDTQCEVYCGVERKTREVLQKLGYKVKKRRGHTIVSWK